MDYHGPTVDYHDTLSSLAVLIMNSITIVYEKGNDAFHVHLSQPSLSKCLLQLSRKQKHFLTP